MECIDNDWIAIAIAVWYGVTVHAHFISIIFLHPYCSMHHASRHTYSRQEMEKKNSTDFYGHHFKLGNKSCAKCNRKHFVSWGANDYLTFLIWFLMQKRSVWNIKYDDFFITEQNQNAHSSGTKSLRYCIK